MIKEIFTIISIWSFVIGLSVLSLDALEWEQTGECRDCIVLPHLADRFTEPSGRTRY